MKVAWLALAIAMATPAAAAAETRVLSAHLVERGRAGDVIAVFAAPRADATPPVRVRAKVLRRGTDEEVAADMATWRGGWLTASWPTARVRPGETYDVCLCLAGAACDRPVRFTAPGRPPAPARRPFAPVLLGLCAVVGVALARRRRLHLA